MRLIAENVDVLKWIEFEANGFSSPVSGVVYEAGQSSCGLPLGGIGTGCMDLDTDGTLGRCSIFNSVAPPRVLDTPFIFLNAEGTTWALATRKVPGARSAKGIRYWGHYPVADLEYEFDGPINAGLRAWCPFLPGDSSVSNTPGVVFEIRLRNVSPGSVAGTLACAFPGPSDNESGAASYRRESLTAPLYGTAVHASADGGPRPECEYALAALDEPKARTGGSVSNWTALSGALPDAQPHEAAATVAVDFELPPGEILTIRFILAWYAPKWEGTEYRHYIHAYASRFDNASEVAEFLAQNHDSILGRILAWQQVIYDATKYPIWLRDQLVNIMHTISEDAFWACDSIPHADWCGSDGIFGLTESPRSVPHVAIPSDWYGSLPLIFFFPDLFAALLRGYAHFQLPTGEIPLGLGWGADLGSPIYDFLRTTNGPNFIDLAGRLLERGQNDALLRELYPAVKKAIEFTQTLDRDDDGLLDLDPWPTGNQFYGAWHWVGTATHPNGYWLAALAAAERMAEAAGDLDFAASCRAAYQKGAAALEQKLWNGNSYLLYSDPASGAKSDTILSNQLAGQWLADLHGLAPVFPKDRVHTVLDTVMQTTVPRTEFGLLNAIRPDGTFDKTGDTHSLEIFPGENLVVAATLIYSGDKEAGLAIAEQVMSNIVLLQRRGWDMPNMIDPVDGSVTKGTDFYQMMIQWALPLALDGKSIRGMCAPGELVDRVLQAARQE